MRPALATVVAAFVFLEVASALPVTWQDDRNQDNSSDKRAKQLRGPPKSGLTTQVRGSPSTPGCPRRLLSLFCHS